MKTLSEQHWEAIEFEGDLRWELVERVSERSHLIGSGRLRDFLVHVTACAIRETPEDATEQQIGIQVFQRSPGFNSSEDSIVRSQARLLRLKLAAYFNAEGASEPLIIEIPKGHYFPVFVPSHRVELVRESLDRDSPDEDVEEANDVPLSELAGVDKDKLDKTERQRGWLPLTGVGLALLLCLSLIAVFLWQRQVAVAKPLKQLWAPFLMGNPPLVIYSNALFVGVAKHVMRYAATDGSDGGSAELIGHHSAIRRRISIHALSRIVD